LRSKYASAGIPSISADRGRRISQRVVTGRQPVVISCGTGWRARSGSTFAVRGGGWRRAV